MKKKINIRTGLLITLFILIVVTMLALWLIQTVFMDDFYQSVRRSDVTRLSEKISSVLSEDWRTQLDDEDFQDQIQELCRDGEASYCFFLNGAPYGVSYVQDDMLFRLIIEHKLDQYVSDAKKDSTSMHPVMNETDEPYALVLVKGLKSDKDTLVLVIATTLIPTSSLTRTVTIQLIAVTVVLVGLAVALAFLLSKKMAKPITKLSEVSKRLADGSSELDFPKPTGVREIDELVESLNTTSIELSKTDKLQRDLMANISHDLKTPLTLIQGYAEMMRDIPSENNFDNIEVIINETKRLSDLVGDVLDLSKLQSGVVRFDDTEYDIVNSIRTVISRYTALCGDEYTFFTQFPDHPIIVKADETRISQAITNLINNALKYTGDDKKIYVKLQPNPDSVTFMIKDTGKGIPEDKTKDVWQRYYKIDGADLHDRFQVGSGLGLSIVKEVLSHYTDDYGVKNVNDGCIFYFTIKTISETKDME